MIEPDAVELRVLGALIEKQRVTPDAYPLTLNSLRLATNQATGRDPVVDLDDGAIRDAVARLVRRGWARLASGPGSRATKYRHLLDEALGLQGAELSLLAVLLLRGAQTPGELRQRVERLHAFADISDVEASLERLALRGFVRDLGRRPGQKESRFEQTLGGTPSPPSSAPQDGEARPEPPVPDAAWSGAVAPSPFESAAAIGATAPPGLAERVSALEHELAELRAALERLAGGELAPKGEEPGEAN